MKDFLHFPPQPVLQVRGLMRLFRLALWKSGALLVIGTVASAVSPYLLSRLIDAASSGAGGIWSTGIWFLLASLVSALCYSWGGIGASVAGESAIAVIRDSIVQWLGHHRLHGRLSDTSRLVSAVGGDSASLAVFFRYALPEVLPAAGSLLAIAMGIVLVSPILFAATIGVAIPLMLFAVRLVVANRRQYAAERAASGEVQGALNGLGGGTAAVGDIEPLLNEEYRVSVRTAAVRSGRKAYLVLVEFAVLASCLLIGLWMVGLGHTTVGEVAAVAIFTVRMATQIDVILEHLDEYQQVRVAMTRINTAMTTIETEKS